MFVARHWYAYAQSVIAVSCFAVVVVVLFLFVVLFVACGAEVGEARSRLLRRFDVFVDTLVAVLVLMFVYFWRFPTPLFNGWSLRRLVGWLVGAVVPLLGETCVTGGVW